MLARRSPAAAPTRALRRPRAPLPFAFYRARWLSTSTQEPSHTLAVVGGGLSGLSSAFYFVKALSPEARRKARVVLLERETRIGGWCKSVPVPAADGVVEKRSDASVIFETGPRSIRPVGLQGWLTVELAHSLGLADSLITVPKTAASAKKRYVYYPSTLTLLPSSLATAVAAAFTTPIIRSALPGILLEPFRPRSPLHAQADGGDESVDAFFARRFGAALAENLISAMIHGIYSGDTRRLSVRAVFPGLWEAEREWGSVVRAGLFGGLWRRLARTGVESTYRISVRAQDAAMADIKVRLAATPEGAKLVARMEEASVWGVRGGLESLTDALRRWLVAEGVDVKTGPDGDVTGIEHKNGHWTITTPTSTLSPTYLITSNPSVLPPSLRPPSIPSTTVSVVNLAFPSSAALFPRGFGYLIPRSVPLARNPHHALGVIYDSDVMPSLDTSAAAGLTKISMLLGGAYWLDGAPSPAPSHATLVQWALHTLRLHFPATSFPAPIHTLSHTHVDCIPQVPVNYFKHMRALGKKLREAGDVAVAGGGTGTIGVNGAVKGAWEVGTSFGERVSGGEGPVRTGVEMWD